MSTGEETYGEDTYGKDTTGFRSLTTSLEPLLGVGPETTPVERFFVCSAGPAPDLEPDSWRLRIGGPAAHQRLEFTLGDLQRLPQREVVAWLECAGNGRRLFNVVAGHNFDLSTQKTPWTLGGLGLATWTGVSLRLLLERAGVSDDARWLSPVGLDVDNTEGEPVRMCLPVDKGLDPDTIVALTMNGEPLTRAHGAPARLIVPGWVGAYSVKWLDAIDVATEWIPSYRSDEYYVHRDADGSPTGPVTAHPVRSQLALNWPSIVDAGPHRIWGMARSGHGPIAGVEWQLDEAPWHPAVLDPAADRWAWTPFHFDLTLDPGDHLIRTRAGDTAGNTQPADQPPHRDGVLWNAVIPHPVTAVG